MKVWLLGLFEHANPEIPDDLGALCCMHDEALKATCTLSVSPYLLQTLADDGRRFLCVFKTVIRLCEQLTNMNCSHLSRHPRHS